jgi:hypothetical protein
MVERADFVRSDFEASGEWSEVSAIADRLVLHLNEPETSSLIALANPPGQSSAQVQAVLLREATALGFTDERKGLFAAYDSALRPDYHLSVGGTGVILEVERGKTTINNMDLLDLWKCHICDHADYLFLMVPLELRQNPSMRAGVRSGAQAPRHVLPAWQLHQRPRSRARWVLSRLRVMAPSKAFEIALLPLVSQSRLRPRDRT